MKYEEKRKLRIEENKKRMEELNLHKLYQCLKPTPTNNYKLSVKKKATSNALVHVTATLRRSTRMLHNPPPILPTTRRSFLIFGTYYSIMRRDLFYHVDTTYEERVYTIKRAEKLEMQLGSEFPTFVKPLLQGHLRGVLSIPKSFSDTFLPDHDKLFTLIDENGCEWHIKYLVRYSGLSSGWHAFVAYHCLVDGDALVFQLTQPNVFKVYIFHLNSSKEDAEQVGDKNY